MLAALTALCLLAAPADPPPLSGPRAEPAAAQPASRPRPTIVHRDFAGGVTPTPLSPEAAALEALALPPADRAAADAVLVRRARIIEDLVASRLEQFTKLATASATQNGADIATQLGTMIGHAAAITAPGPLREQIDRVLPENGPARAEFARILDEYWSAVYQSRAEAAPKDNPPGRAGVIAQVRLEALGREVEAAFNRMLASGTLTKVYLTKDLGLSPEQDARVAQLAEEYARLGETPSKAQETAFFLRLLSLLTPEQQTKLIAKVRGVNNGAASPPPPQPRGKQQPAATPMDGNPPQLQPPATTPGPVPNKP